MQLQAHKSKNPSANAGVFSVSDGGPGRNRRGLSIRLVSPQTGVLKYTPLWCEILCAKEEFLDKASIEVGIHQS